MPRGQLRPPVAAFSTTLDLGSRTLVMRIVHTCCAGLDVHKKSVTACVCRVNADGEFTQETRTFSTVTSALLALGDWLAQEGVCQVAMESTGVYWKPVFHILEDRFEVMLVNAQHIKRVPGRKTDVKDAEWIAELLQHGLLSPSFIPPLPIRELRDLTRQRTQLVRERAAVVNRVQKVLEVANIKLASVASDSLGISGRAMIRAMIAGQDDANQLAELARKRLRSKLPQLKLALSGRVTDHHRFLLRMLMNQIEHLEAMIEEFQVRIAAQMAPFDQAATRIRTIPGIAASAAEVIVAEIGTEMSRFPTSGRLASWAGLCPGNDQSAGKRRSGKTTKGSQWLRTMLVQVAWAASHAKGTIFKVMYSRWVKRMGKQKALVAVAHKILVLIHKLLKDAVDYHERHAPPEAA
jgi:transposase